MSKTTENMALPPFHLLIVAAGQSTRMGNDIPKPFLNIYGKSILQYSLDTFQTFEELRSVTIVINLAHQEFLSSAVLKEEKHQYVFGGKTRKESVYNGLRAIPNVKKDDLVLIHDAARPLVRREDIVSLLQTMKQSKAASLVTKTVDTLIHADNIKMDRERIFSVQTPQAFSYEILRKAHEDYLHDETFTDDAGMVTANGIFVEKVLSSRNNIKITTPEDIKMVQSYLSQNMETRAASGFDVHAFEKQPSDRPLMMGGVKMDYPLALAGHSDADVVLHAITDAILGAINEGDIGTHFPPSDSQWKNADSSIFLKHAVEIVNKMGGEISFVDITILAEEPKIGLYRETMQNRIGQIMGLTPKRISIKATTTEKLGFTGRKEGIACQALATIRLPVTN